MCARREAALEVQAAAQCLTQACREGIAAALRRLHADMLVEPLPPDLDALLRKLE